jgi:CheY-like chemotaxis protein
VPCILVADDNANIQKMVSLAFQDRGIKVISVGNGEAAVRRILELNPDLVLADIFMPVRNGYEVCEFVKKDQRFSHVPVILLVGAFDPLDEKEARRVGADGVLKKPFVPPDPLIAMVMSALEKNPKVIAELAKAKASLEPHALAEPPGPIHDGVPFQVPAPPKLEVKPLPEFPEPSPEEAALVYGLGKGQRTLDREELAAAGEPPSPVVQEEEEAPDEPFDGAATTSDWRRNAMDFEVPAEAAHGPAFSGSDLDPIALLPKSDTLPAPSFVPEPPRKIEPAVQELHEEPPSAPPERKAFWEETKQLPAHVTQAAASPTISTDARVFEREAEPAPATVPSLELRDQPEPVSAPTAPHWMDAIASFSPSAQRARGWTTVLSEQSAEIQAVEESTAAPDGTIATVADLSEEHEFFAEEPEPSEAVSISSPTAAMKEAAPQPSPVPFASAEPEPGFGPLDASSEDRPSFQEPDLVKPPAVRVIPEPLLIEEESSQPSASYGNRQEELTPLHSFTVPEPPVSSEPAAEEEASAVGPSHDDLNGCIPTGPPPSREALAGIPFLNPPPGFDPNAPEEEAPSANTVDAAVQKIIERLEPQLHDLLEKTVLKPLIESLLQQELAKRGEK